MIWPKSDRDEIVLTDQYPSDPTTGGRTMGTWGFLNPAGIPISQKFAVQDPEIQSCSTEHGNPKGHLYWHPIDVAPHPSSNF